MSTGVCAIRSAPPKVPASAWSPRCVNSWLHGIELMNAFQMHVFVGKQPGNVRVTSEQAAMAWQGFQGHFAA
ncbi:MAG TPA: hypothetical protein DCE44_24040, partial [Verrucomicrobiales bacterium]|nr:hypothetical protein [Verrucomicrobiales bacterium]